MQASSTAVSATSPPNPQRTEAYRNRFLLSRKYNLCYAAVDKAACTTLKWWMADIEGIRDGVVAHLARHKGNPQRAKGIHAAFGEVAPHLVPRTFAQIRDVFDSGSYFCFAVVRNPYTRLFSAWSDKFLKGRNDKTRLALDSEELLGRAPASVEEVRACFEAFLTHLHDVPDMLLANRHWIPQFYLLRPDLLRYDCIVGLEQPERLKASLAGILGTHYKDPLAKREARNVSTLGYHPDFISPGAARLIRTLYADDFASFGYNPRVLPPGRLALDRAAVERKLAKLMQERIAYSYRKLVNLEREKDRLQGSPVRAFLLFLSSVAAFFRYPAENALYALRRLFKK